MPSSLLLIEYFYEDLLKKLLQKKGHFSSATEMYLRVLIL